MASLWALALACVTLACTHPESRDPRAPDPAAPPAAAMLDRGETGSRVESPVTGVRIRVGFRTHRHWMEHFEKHGREFGNIDPERYLLLAQTLRDRPAGGFVLEAARGDGAISRFDRKSGAFGAYDRDGTIRTFFKPRDGESYFRRQILRYSRRS